MKDCILILGAGLMQEPSIEAARELGYEHDVVDANPNAVCADCDDIFVQIDLKDRYRILAYAKNLGSSLKAVWTAGTDFSSSVSFVAENLGLPCHSFESTLNATNKIRMRECFKNANVPCPEFTSIHRNELAEWISNPQKINSLCFPMVIKPADNMGGRGCRLIRCPKEFLLSVENAVASSRSSTAILEDYMEGPEYSIDAFMYGGKFYITGFADRHIFYPPYFIEKGHTMPTKCGAKEYRELCVAFAKGALSLGLSLGPCKADIKYTENGPMIGEIAARLSGGYMSGWTYPYASGINLTKEGIKIALGRKPDQILENATALVSEEECGIEILDVKSVYVSAERAYVSIPGTVSQVLGSSKAISVPFVRNYFPRTSGGDTVDFPHNNVEKSGNFISLSSDYELAVEASENAAANMVLRLEPHNAATDRFWSGVCGENEDSFPPDAFVLSENQKMTLDQELKDAPVIARGQSVFSYIPPVLDEIQNSLRDYNYRTIRKTLELFDAYAPEHEDLEGEKFWRALIRGGLQLALYYSDNQKKGI